MDSVHGVFDQLSAPCGTCLQVLKCQEAASGDTTKLLIQLQDGMQVESVVMHYDTTGEAALPLGSAAACCSSASTWQTHSRTFCTCKEQSVPWSELQYVSAAGQN